MVCDLTLASEDHAKFLQTDPDVASYDAGFGSAYLAKQIGQKKAREVFWEDLLRRGGRRDGHGQRGRPHEEVEETALEWGERINAKSPTAMRMPSTRST